MVNETLLDPTGNVSFITARTVSYQQRQFMYAGHNRTNPHSDRTCSYPHRWWEGGLRSCVHWVSAWFGSVMGTFWYHWPGLSSHVTTCNFANSSPGAESYLPSAHRHRTGDSNLEWYVLGSLKITFYCFRWWNESQQKNSGSKTEYTRT
jgi:hypothetical protein